MIAQHITSVPDSLKKYSYAELSNIIDKKWKKGEETLYYSKVYLLKAKKENNYHEIISAWIWMGIEANNFDINIKYCDSAISLAKKKNLENLAQLYWDKANVYYNQKRLKEALNYYLIANQYPNKSIELAESINFIIGAIKSTQGDYQEAIAILKKCEEYPRAQTFSDYPRYLLALSENYNRINQIKTANEYIIKGIEVCRFVIFFQQIGNVLEQLRNNSLQSFLGCFLGKQAYFSDFEKRIAFANHCIIFECQPTNATAYDGSNWHIICVRTNNTPTLAAGDYLDCWQQKQTHNKRQNQHQINRNTLGFVFVNEVFEGVDWV